MAINSICLDFTRFGHKTKVTYYKIAQSSFVYMLCIFYIIRLHLCRFLSVAQETKYVSPCHLCLV